MAATGLKIIRASKKDAERIAPLFDAYRQFYEKEPDAALALDYISKRLSAGECVIFLATDGKQDFGFTQLYPTFCSVEAKNIWVLYDLFVAPNARGKGIGRALMEAARGLGEDSGAAFLSLNTAVTNHKAQALYESLNYHRDKDFYTYYLDLSA